MYVAIYLGMLLLVLTLPASAESLNSEPEIKRVARANYLKQVDAKSSTASIEAILATEITAGDLQQSLTNLSLAEVVQQVVAHNYKVRMQQADWGIKLAEEEKAHAFFEPELVAAVKLEDNSQRNSIEESLSRSLATSYHEHNWDYSAVVNGFMPTGASYELGYNLRTLANSVTDSIVGDETEYQTYLGFSISQPLLKNAGVAVTSSGIRAAETETEATFQQYREELMRTVNNASLAYWDCYQAQEKLNLVQDSIRIAEKILVDNQARQRTGKMAETEVYEAMIGVATRRSLLTQVRQEQLTTINSLKKLLAYNDSTGPLHIQGNEQSTPYAALQDKDLSIQQALSWQPGYLATQAKINQAEIKVAFAENQRWPELDLSASYGLNGLDFKHSGSLGQIEDAEYDAWSIGLEFRLPLLGGIESRSELKKTQLEKRRLLLALKDVELKIAHDIDTSINEVNNAAEQTRYAEEIVSIQKKLLDVELNRLQSGKSSSRHVLEKEDSYRNALEVALKNRVKLQTALNTLQLTTGTILLNHGVEIMEKNSAL